MFRTLASQFSNPVQATICYLVLLLAFGPPAQGQSPGESISEGEKERLQRLSMMVVQLLQTAKNDGKMAGEIELLDYQKPAFAELLGEYMTASAELSQKMQRTHNEIAESWQKKTRRRDF